jgi:8-amino-7-oxononanoate synthase
MNNKIISIYDKKLLKITNQSQKRHIVTTIRKKDSVVTRNKKNLISFSCNDYLGLSQNKEVIEAGIKAIKKYGVGSGASRLVSGNNLLYEKLEYLLASFKNGEAACVFGSGYLTNTGVIPSLTTNKDLLIFDELSHASTNIGIKLSSSKSMKFNHNDTNHVEELLKKHRKKYISCFILTEGVFSMDGDRGRIKELAYLANKYDASIMLDDAHGFGVLGDGRGSQYELNPAPEVLIQMGTLSKAIGSYGGFIVAPKTVVDLLHNKARSLIYTTALPPSILASAIKSLEIIKRNKSLVKKPYDNAKLFCKLADLPEPESSIVTIILKSENKAIDASKILEKNGYYISAIRPPTVPINTSRLRLTFSASHKKKDIISLSKLIKGLNF